jgi:hypothetical protein
MASGPSYPSKRDWWIAAIIWGGVATMLAPTLVIERVAPPGHSLLVLQLAPLVVAGFMVWVLYGTFYEFAGELLVIRCGPFRFRVPRSASSPVRQPQDHDLSRRQVRVSRESPAPLPARQTHQLLIMGEPVRAGDRYVWARLQSRQNSGRTEVRPYVSRRARL